MSLAALLLLGATAVADEFAVYKWVDKDGVPQYTDRPPSNADVSFTGIRSQRTDPDAVMARAEQQAQSNADRAEGRQEASQTAAQSAADRRRTREERQAECEKARERAETYNTARRLYRPLEGGGRQYLTDEELTEARATANADVSSLCD
jgi:hypothetical protein